MPSVVVVLLRKEQTRTLAEGPAGARSDRSMAGRRGALALIVVAALCLPLEAVPLQGAAEPLVPSIFVFGDSLVDVGNNNHLPQCNATCRANYSRYGIDHPKHRPTGRFSNGYNLADQLAQLLGFRESPPPLLSLPRAKRVPQMCKGGINFASGGSGLLPKTGPPTCQQVVPMDEQVGNFTKLVRAWKRKDPKEAADVISKSLFFISVGSNDLFEYAFNVELRNGARNDTELLQLLLASYTGYVKKLYDAGAKKFSVVSPSLVGCCPSQRAIANTTGDLDNNTCLGLANSLSRQLHPMIESMLDDLSVELPCMHYSLGDSISMAEWVFDHAREPPLNFTDVKNACCGTSDFGAGVCNASAHLCQNRGNYFFWDRFHPTDAASRLTAQQLFTDTGTFVYPINVQQLVALRE